jgi:serine/threonine protein kinase
MLSAEENDRFHQEHPFTLPKSGSVIISPNGDARFEIGDRLDEGEGAFGYVYECRDPWGHDLVAKVLKPSVLWQETRDRAISEVAAMSIGRSPYVVQIHDAFSFQGAHYIISERCAFTLKKFIGRDSVETSRWLKSLARDLLHAIQFFHNQGLTHCDIHSANVFLTRIPDTLMPNDHGALVFKLGDFGLARPIGQMRPHGTWNPSCCPPEVIKPKFGQIDSRADLYQAGLLLLNFYFGNDLDFSKKDILQGRPRELAEAIPHPAGPLIAKLLRRHVDARPATALEAWLELESLLQTQ